MTASRALLQTTTTLLACALICLPFNLLFAAIALTGQSLISFYTSLLLVSFAGYLHLRIAFDRHILRAFLAHENDSTGHIETSNALSPEDFDQALIQLGLRKNTPQRSIRHRCQGAVMLWKQLGLITLAQALCLLIFR